MICHTHKIPILRVLTSQYRSLNQHAELVLWNNFRINTQNNLRRYLLLFFQWLKINRKTAVFNQMLSCQERLVQRRQLLWPRVITSLSSRGISNQGLFKAKRSNRFLSDGPRRRGHLEKNVLKGARSLCAAQYTALSGVAPSGPIN